MGLRSLIIDFFINLNMIDCPKCWVMIPSLVICKGKRDLIKGVPKITLFLRFLTNKKGVSILRLWFSIIVVDNF